MTASWLADKIEQWPTAKLVPYARNARTHSDAQVAQIAASIAEFGFTNPILAGSDGVIVAGHGRVMAAKSLGLEQVPVLVLDHLTEAQRRAYVIADNKLALNAGWDEGLLRSEIQALGDEGFDLSLAGFDWPEVAELLKPPPVRKGKIDDDQAPEAPARACSRAGDTWILDRHRLRVGDATSAADLDALLQGKEVDLVWTDPPYNVAIKGKAGSILNDDMEGAARKAEIMPSALNNFLTKRLNVWVSGETSWMDMRAWERCADKTLQLSDFAGEPCWMGLDLAQKKDFAALCLVFQRESVWTVFTRLYLNELAVQESGNAHLSGWARSGHVQVTDGDITDFDIVAEDLRSYCRQFDVQEIAFDPALSMYFAGKLIEEGLPLVEITQRAMFFTPALIQVENMVLEKKLKFDGNPVMTWMVSNLVVKVSKFNELRSPTKERPENKIDGPMAMLMALGRALANTPKDNIDDFLNEPISL